MIKAFLLWLLRDELIEIARHEAQKVIGVMYLPSTNSETNQYVKKISKVYLRKGTTEIFLNDFTVREIGDETFSAPATVVMEGVAIPATANFKVTHVNGEELESYKGDLLEVSVKDDGTGEVTDFIPRDIAETDVVAKVAEREISKRMGRRPKYDRDAIEDDIRSGYSVAEAAERNGVSYPTASKIKKEMQGHGDSVELPKDFGKVREVGPETNVDAEIKLLFVQGFKVKEVADMYPMVSLDQIVALKGKAHD